MTRLRSFGRQAVLFAVIAATACGIAKAAEPEPMPEDSESAARRKDSIARLTSAIEYEMEAKSLPALSIAVVDDQEVVWSGGFGFADADRKIPADARTCYRVGSISKLFTDVALMKLVERGEIDLDAPVTKYLPDFAPQNPHAAPITLRMLTSHRGGLVRESPVGNYFDDSEPTLADTVASLNETALVYPPGARAKYSNAGIAVVGAVLERKAGMPFDQWMTREILEPLAMDASDFAATDEVKAKLATGWMWTYDGRRFAAPTFALGTAPAGNLYSDVLDLSKFLSFLFEGSTEEGALLRPETIQAMTTLPEGETEGFGIGFHISKLDGEKAIGHGGAVYGFATELKALPERKLGVAVATSLDCANGVGERIGEYALRLLLAEKDGRAAPDYRLTAPVAPERSQELVGSYRGKEAKDGFAEVSELAGRTHLLRGPFRRELRAAQDDGSLLADDVFGFGDVVAFRDGALAAGDVIYDRLPDEPPPEAPEKWRDLIGEYGWDHNTLYILEDRGRLVALIEWFFYYPLEQVGEDEFAFPDYGLYHGEKLIFQREEGQVVGVVAASVDFPRRESAKDGETFKIEPLKPIDELRADALAADPPVERELAKPELVELTSLDPTIKLDIRYATDNNFMGAVFYESPRAFMQRPAAEALVRVHKRLGERGMGLLIHDAYRPWHVTKMFWDATPDRFKDFVADPSKGSRHNRGCAVDLTLYDLATGEPLTMVAGYDEFSSRAFPEYPGGTSLQRWRRSLLRRSMEAEGFSVFEFEWWHFDYRDWRRYPILDVPFEEID